MMRHHSSIALGLAALFVLPASLPGGQDSMSLEERLEATVAAIEHLGGIERRIHAGEMSVFSELLLVTETPIPDAQQRDENLALLRVEVAALTQRWDELSMGASPLTAGVQPLPAPTDGQTAAAAPTHVGLRPGAHADIRQQAQPRDLQAPPTTDNLRDFEVVDYSADALRQGRLLVRAERWSDALVVLEPLKEETEARYWIACCYENLGRAGEAIELLQGLVSAGQPDEKTGAEAPAEAQSLSRRASYNLKFLELRRELADRRGAQEQGK